MAARQDMLLALIRKYEAACKEDRLLMTAIVVGKCREAAAPVPSRLKPSYVNVERAFRI